MKRFFLVLTVLFGTAASAQNIDTTFIVQYRTSLDTARNMPKPERAASYWNAAKAYAAQAKWDTAAKALDKSNRYFPIDSLVTNADVNGLVAVSKIEHNRNKTNKAIAYAERAMAAAQHSYTTDSLVALSGYLQELYTANSNPAMVWRYKYFSDSLHHAAYNKIMYDSLSILSSGLSDARQTNDTTELQLAAARDENKQLNDYLLWLAVAAVLLLIGLVVALLTRKKTLNTSIATDSDTSIKATTRDAVHGLTGITDLMLQRGRTGDDLILLKAMERELQRLWQQTGPTPFPTIAIDEDRTIRQLKGIRILIFSDNADAAFLLKNWLRKQIRLCDIETALSFETLPSDFHPQVIVYDALSASVESFQRLSSIFSDIPVIVSSATLTDTIDASVLQKPYALSLLLERLIKLYSPSEEIKPAEPVTPPPVATPAVDINAIDHNCNLLEEAYAERNGDKLTAACYALMPLFEQANSPATKWLKLLAEPPENISEVHVELAYRNVIAYCRNASK